MNVRKIIRVGQKEKVVGDKKEKRKRKKRKKTGSEGHSKCNTEVIDSCSHVIILRVPVECAVTPEHRQPSRASSVEMTPLRHPFETERLRPLDSSCFVVSSCGDAGWIKEGSNWFLNFFSPF